MEKDLSNSWSIVTGASTGIGREMAKVLASLGSNLIIVARNENQLQSLKDEIHKNESSNLEKKKIVVEIISLDLSEVGSGKKLFDQALKISPKIQILINNAGVGNFGPFLNISLLTLLNTHHLNTTTLLELCHYFLNHMKAHGDQSYILNVSSVVGHFSIPYVTHYCATKHFVQHLTLNLAAELSGSNIKISSLMPGKTATEFARRAQEKTTPFTQGAGMSANKVAQVAVLGMLKGKAMIIPGLKNKFICFILNFIPQEIISKLAIKILKTST